MVDDAIMAIEGAANEERCLSLAIHHQMLAAEQGKCMEGDWDCDRRVQQMWRSTYWFGRW